MICTSIEQSRRLLELSLDPKTADCHYKDIGNVGEHYKLEAGVLVGKWADKNIAKKENSYGSY